MKDDREKYVSAMRRGDTDTCIRIEQAHGLFGYPPELVSIGLAAAAEFRDPVEAVEAYLRDQP